MPLVRAVLILLVAAAPAAAVTTTMSQQVLGGFAPLADGGRTAYGFLHFGAVPGAYEVIEHPTGDGKYEGTFKLYMDRTPIAGTTTLVPGDPAYGPRYTRTWTVDSNDYNCQSSTGRLVSDGDYESGATFFERLEGSFECAIAGSGSPPGVGESARFRVRMKVTAYDGPTTNSVIGRLTSGMMFTRDPGIGLLRCYLGDTRCSFEIFDTSGSLFGSFPVRVSHKNGRYVYRPGRGSTQVGGHGDPEYRRVRATSGWKLRGTLDKHHRGTLTLTGSVFR